MKNKTLEAVIIVVVVAAVIVVLFIWKKERVGSLSGNGATSTTHQTGALITKQATMVSVDRSEYLYSVSGLYPQFSQASSAFNKKIADAVTGDISDFVTNASDNYKARLDTGGDEFQKQFAEGNFYQFQVKTDVVQ